MGGDGPVTCRIAVRTEAQRDEVCRGNLTLVFEPAGKGVPSHANRAGSDVVAACAAGGLSASLLVAGAEAEPLEPIAGSEVERRARRGRRG